MVKTLASVGPAERPQEIAGRARFGIFVALVGAVAACRPSGPDPGTPSTGAAVCSARALPACEAAIANAVALGDDVGPLAEAYAAARKSKDRADPFARALELAKTAAATAEKKVGSRAALALAGGAADPGAAKDLPRFEIASFEPAAKATPPELLFVALAEGAGLELLAVARKDGTLVRAYGHDPLIPWMAGLAPVVVDTDMKVLERDAQIEKELRASVRLASSFDYVGASDHVDAAEALVKGEDPYDAEAIRARIVLNALGISAPEPLLSTTTRPTRAPEPDPRATDTPYYDLLRVRYDRTAAKAFERRRDHLLSGAPADLRPLIDRMWGSATSCTVTLPPAFDRPRDLAFAYLLPAALLPAGARDERGRLGLSDWYARYEKLVELVERSHTGYLAAMVLVAERGGTSSITPAGSNSHRRVDEIALKHARALEALARAKPGRVGVAQLGFIASPAAYADEGVSRALHDLARVAAQGSLAEAHDAWDVLASALTGALLSTSMPPEVRQEHITALASAFSSKLTGELRTQTGWGTALAYGVELAYRVFTGFSPDPKASVEQISRALETDPKIAQPGLAALTSALVRYASLAAEDGLGSPFLDEGESTPPARSAARESLSKALAALAEPGSQAPDKKAIHELASFADNATATLAFALVPKKGAPAKAGTGAKEACEASDDAPVDPRVTRALSKLRDQRRRVLGLKQLREGSDAWSKRARLIALLLSDGIDVAGARADGKRAVRKPKGDAKPKPKKEGSLPATEITKFFVPSKESEAFLKEALESLGADRGIVGAAQSAYGLARGFFGAGTAYFEDPDGRKTAGALLSSIGELLSEPGSASATSGLLAGLSRSLGPASASTPAFVEVARGAYDKGDASQADMILLAAVVASALTEGPLSPEAYELASQKKSAMAWLFDFLRYARPTATTKDDPRPGRPLFKPGLDALLSQKCAAASTSTLVDVLDAVDRFKKGDRDRARADLEAALAKGEKDLSLPHVSFTFKQETTTRAINLSIDIALASPFVTGTGGLNVGGGFKSAGDPKLELAVEVDSADSKRARDDTARYFVHATAIAAVYHFLSSDPDKAERAAARALGAMVQRTNLFLPGVTDDPIKFADAAQATLAIVAQQAIDSGRPLLAGSLLQVLRSTFDPKTTRSSDITAILDTLPKPLRGISDLEPVVERARKTLASLGGGFPCVGPKIDKAVFLTPACAEYPRALALRVADSLAGLPKLASVGNKDRAAKGCGELSALDAFLVPAQNGKYEPDRFAEAVDRMLEQNKPFEAAFLLTRPRDPQHCSERVVAQMRKTAERLEGVPTFRADLLTAVVNCEVGAPASVLSVDLAALDKELDLVGDGSRQIQIGFFSAALAARRAEPAIADVIIKRSGFVARHRKHGPLLPIALLLDHLASSLAGKAPDVKATQSDMELLCGLGDKPAGPDTCKMLKELRQDGDAAQRKRVAEAIIAKLSPR